MQGDNPLSSARNIALVMIQNPEAALFGTRDRWKSQGRFVLDTEQDRGAKIFVRPPSRRGYTLADAFDITQTQGRTIEQSNAPALAAEETPFVYYPISVEE